MQRCVCDDQDESTSPGRMSGLGSMDRKDVRECEGDKNDRRDEGDTERTNDDDDITILLD